MSRYIHEKNLKRGTEAHAQGERQFELNIQRFHYLCAAATKQYTILDNIPPDPDRGQLFPRQGIDFSPYRAYKFQPITGVKLHPRSDGTIHPGDIEAYVDAYKGNWKSREGGILYFLAGDVREFWNMIINYHSSSHTTGIREWDEILDKLKVKLDKKVVPCMFYARASGCLKATCPFLHDKAACLREREQVLQTRRNDLSKPTTRDLSLHYTMRYQKIRASRRASTGATTDPDSDMSDDDDDPEVRKLWDEQWMVEKICSNPQCLAVKWKGSAPESERGKPIPDLKACSRCKVTFYCSPKCQREDWKRHKREPCLPYEELVEDDELWDRWGVRKGTGDPKIQIIEG